MRDGWQAVSVLGLQRAGKADGLLSNARPRKENGGMRYLALATDYDGTLATDDVVNAATVRALEKLKASGRRLLLVTGRHLPDLQRVFEKLDLFDRVVAENGALLYDPASREERVLAEPPKEEFLQGLRAAGVDFAVGRAIVASWAPSEVTILKVIKELGLDYQVIFNKGAVMVLPSGINKATGLKAGLDDLQLSHHNTVAIGDAENDQAFLSASECGVAVANALPALRETADVVTKGDHGRGVVELIEGLLEDDLRSFDERLERSAIPIGNRAKDGRVLRIIPNRNSALVAGASASGKSSAVAAILEECEERGYQFCLIDPEGDFEGFAGAAATGSASEKPDGDMLGKALEDTRSLVVNLMAVPLAERPAVFGALLPRILEMRARTGRPHWLVADEAHHLLPTMWSPASIAIPQELGGTILITVHPEHVSAAALAFVDVAIATGKAAVETLAAFAKAAEIPAPGRSEEKPPESGEALLWFVRRKEATPSLLRTRRTKTERRRHKRNYALGELSPEQSFYFRGPESKLNLRAQNLMTFLQVGEGVDEETWRFHAQLGDYSRWFETVIKDQELAQSAREIESDGAQDLGESRKKLRAAVESRYTAPA
jgi:hydroxymethylpyrimidine pyrophosphatase-like HAD family hydrolase